MRWNTCSHLFPSLLFTGSATDRSSGSTFRMAPHLGDEVGACPCLEAFLLEPLISFSSGCLGFLRVVIVIQKHVFQKIEIWSYLYIKSSAWKRSFLLDSIGQSRYRECLDLWRQNLNLAFSREKQQKKFWRYLWWRKWREAKFTQLCPTLCDPMNYTVYGII